MLTVCQTALSLVILYHSPAEIATAGLFFFFKQKTAYEIYSRDWSSECALPIYETGEFVINLTTKELARATDYCGVRSGRDVDKFKETGLTAVEATKVKAPLIAEAPVNIECRITEKKELGSHHMFLAEVLAVHVDEKYLDENGKFQLNKSGLIAYSHGEYLDLGKEIGTFGYSVKKKTKKPQKRRKKKVER